MSAYWLRLKELLLERWDKLSHDELNNKHQDWSGIIELINSHYPHDQNIPHDFWLILQAHDESWYERHQTSPRSSETSELQDDIGYFKHTLEVEAYEIEVERIRRQFIRP